MSSQLRLALVFGGQSPEHEISILSAKNVYQGLNRDRYLIELIYISEKGAWYWLPHLEAEPSELIQDCLAQLVSLELCGGDSALFYWGDVNSNTNTHRTPVKIDCVFPICHGPNGEDGKLQGMLSLLDIPCVGPDMLSSALCMHKHITKRMLRQMGLPTLDWMEIRRNELTDSVYDEARERLGEVLFVKPSCMGSSIGISKVQDSDAFYSAIESAHQHDRVAIIEPAVEAREIECSVMGNDVPMVAMPGEVVPHRDFYTFEGKYTDANGATVLSPCDLTKDASTAVQSLAISAYQALGCEGMARVDCFMTSDGQLYVNELNTIPGFTDISLYPKNWASSGISLSDLLDKLISYALAEG